MNENVVNSWLTDMDGVLVHDDVALPGAAEFLQELKRTERSFLVLTNNSIYTPRDLSARLARGGIELAEENIWTSALSTAAFMEDQAPGATVYAIGEVGLTTALHESGMILSDKDAEYVVLGETLSWSLPAITRAINLIIGGARFIATNPDPTGPTPEGIVPATGAVAAMITKATGVKPYYCGKPNPYMMRAALNRIGAHSEHTVMVGDRMDTDVISGLEAGMRTILVLTGITKREEIGRFPFRPSRVYESIADVVPLVEQYT